MTPTKGGRCSTRSIAPIPTPLDPFYRANPDALAERDPRRRISDDELAKINAEARRNPIGRIVFTNRGKFQRSTLEAGDIEILTSSDNITYRPLDQPFEFRTTVTEDGFNRFEISGVEIPVTVAGTDPVQ